MELYSALGDITYMSELTPHPVTTKKLYEVSGCGVKFAQAKEEKLKKMALRRFAP